MDIYPLHQFPRWTFHWKKCWKNAKQPRCTTKPRTVAPPHPRDNEINIALTLPDSTFMSSRGSAKANNKRPSIPLITASGFNDQKMVPWCLMGLHGDPVEENETLRNIMGGNYATGNKPWLAGKVSINNHVNWKSWNKHIHQQEPPVGGRKPKYQIQATLAMEQQQIRLEMQVLAAAGTCFWHKKQRYVYSSGPQTWKLKRVSGDRQRRTFYIEDLRRSYYKSVLWASQWEFPTPPMQNLSARISWQRFLQGHKTF